MEPPTGRPGQIPDLNFTFSSLDEGFAGDKRFHDVSRKETHRRAQQKRPYAVIAARISTPPDLVDRA